MSIAAAKRRRRQVKNGNRHLAKIGRPGVPKVRSASYNARKLMRLIEKQKKMAANKARSKSGG